MSFVALTSAQAALNRRSDALVTLALRLAYIYLSIIYRRSSLSTFLIPSLHLVIIVQHFTIQVNSAYLPSKAKPLRLTLAFTAQTQTYSLSKIMDPTSIRHALHKLPLSLLSHNQPRHTEMPPPPPYTARPTPSRQPSGIQPTGLGIHNVQMPSLAPRQTQPARPNTIPLLPEQVINDSDLESMDGDDDDDDEVSEDSTSVHINASTTITGTGNRVAMPRVETARLGALIHGVLAQQQQQQQQSHMGLRRDTRPLNITINCGVTVNGNNNVIALTGPANGVFGGGSAVQQGGVQQRPNPGQLARPSIEAVVGAGSGQRKRGAEEDWAGAERAKSPKREP
ncbi:hypothetical protein EJ05DRAFT_482525 [Pseudovirgaria hyperparasitica]|uniref:Uncharacterized protein n=1 Tax=Pseudovirgaria hyperparasitica TaxID=470096 RepID=A0A6A6WI61_9PEZI|nr:uncharacterized protein EJ05DRAFT_482525 [Pseudovirgaria hyperparasitica]KAF2761676.1 hypothetical protein EJ05DRAFT_482525 [Pseudovirgaria hyperparasitica]